MKGNKEGGACSGEAEWGGRDGGGVGRGRAGRIGVGTWGKG